MEIEKTNRGFNIAGFEDSNGEECSLQVSSSAIEPKIWLGIDNPKPMMLTGNGWEAVPLHKDVMLSGRMHLTIDQVKELLPHLNKFVETGEL
jgi:hypothetical protein